MMLKRQCYHPHKNALTGDAFESVTTTACPQTIRPIPKTAPLYPCPGSTNHPYEYEKAPPQEWFACCMIPGYKALSKNCLFHSRACTAITPPRLQVSREVFHLPLGVLFHDAVPLL